MFLRWGQTAFRNFRVVPPDTGIVHQVNIEYLARVVCRVGGNGRAVAYPDTVFGTDSHTTMVNGLGVVGWGVGGIEAEAAMLGQPSSMLIPPVVGYRLTGRLPEGTTATDLVLTITEALRKKGVVGTFVEFFGPGLKHLTIADRATLGNMCPEYGATIAIFPIDDMTLDYLRLTGRDEAQVALVEAYAKAQGLFRTDATPDAAYSDTLELDLGDGRAEPRGPAAAAGSRAARGAKASFASGAAGDLQKGIKKPARPPAAASGAAAAAVAEAVTTQLEHGSVVIAAITSCTNTSNPSVMIAAGLVAKKAVERGLTTKAVGEDQPGARLEGRDRLPRQGRPAVSIWTRSGSTWSATAARRASATAARCRTRSPRKCAIAAWWSARCCRAIAISKGRIQQDVRANYLASPPLVVAYALAGSLNVDLTTEPLGTGQDGRPVYLKDIWPTEQEIQQHDARRRVRGDVPPAVRERVRRRRALAQPAGADRRSLRVGGRLHLHPPAAVPRGPVAGAAAPPEISGARVLALLGDSITTDHISPAGSIKADSPAGRIPDRAGRRAEGFQLLRRAARQSRGDDARHVRQRAAAQPARARHRRRLDDVSARRRGDDDLRRVGDVSRRRRAARRAGGQGVRIGLVARLGGEGARCCSA